MKRRLAMYVIPLWLLGTASSSAVPPGYYPPNAGNARFHSEPESSAELKLHDIMTDSSGTSILVEAVDQIKVLSPSQSVPDAQTQTLHTREEVSQILKGVPSKKFLRALIAPRIMWEPAEKAESLVRDITPILETSGFDHVVILGLKPHDDAHTLMHPSNGCVRAGVVIFSDWSKKHTKRLNSSP